MKLQATSFITLNPREGETLEKRIGLKRAEIRRCLICDLTNIVIQDLAIKGEPVVKTARTYGTLQLPKPSHDCTPYKNQIYEILRQTLNETGRELVDLETLVMLSTAITGFMEPIEAVKRVLYDAHLLYKILGWTFPEWRVHITAFSQKVPKNINTGISSLNNLTVTNQTLASAFRHLDAGGRVTELITEFGLIFEDVDRIDDGKQGILRITLKYDREGQSIINEITRISKPGCRIYSSVDKLPRVLGGMGIAIVSTSKGVMSDRSCRETNVSGEIVCTVS